MLEYFHPQAAILTKELFINTNPDQARPNSSMLTGNLQQMQLGWADPPTPNEVTKYRGMLSTQYYYISRAIISEIWMA